MSHYWSPMGQIILAVQLADQAHRGQVDKAGDPYLGHPLRAAMIVAEAGKPVEAVIAALLHDAVEDGCIGIELVRSTFGSQVGALVDALSHRKNEPRREYLRRVVAAGPLAVVVKMADYRDNLNEGRLAKLPPDLAARLRAKYEQEVNDVIAMVAN